MLGFSSGLYIGTYYSDYCKPYLDRLLDCLKKEINKSKEIKDDKVNKDN